MCVADEPKQVVPVDIANDMPEPVERAGLGYRRAMTVEQRLARLEGHYSTFIRALIVMAGLVIALTVVVVRLLLERQ